MSWPRVPTSHVSLSKRSVSFDDEEYWYYFCYADATRAAILERCTRSGMLQEQLAFIPLVPLQLHTKPLLRRRSKISGAGDSMADTFWCDLETTSIWLLVLVYF